MLRTRLMCIGYLTLLVVSGLAVDRVLARALFATPSEYVPTYRAFYHPTVGVKIRMLRDRPANDDAWFLGNSLTMLGVDPASYDARLAAQGLRFRSFNVAVPSVGVTFWPEFLERYLPGRTPRYLLLGVQPRDVDIAGVEQVSRPVQRSFWASEGARNRNISRVNADAEEALARAYILWGRRGSFLPAAAGVALRGERFDPDDIRVDNAAGWSRFEARAARPTAELEAGRLRYSGRRGGSFVISPAAKTSLRELATMTSRNGGRLILFTLPTLYDSEPWGTVDIRRGFVAAMRSLTPTLPSARFLDLGDAYASGYRTEDFGDENHLLGWAAQRFSRQVADATLPLLDTRGSP